MQLLAVVLILFCSCQCALSQYSCIPFEGSPLTNGKCNSVVGYPNFLLLASATYDQVDEAAYEKTKLLGAAIPAQCRSALITLICYGSFVRCDITTSGLTVKPPCQSVCTKAVLYCQAVFTALGMASLLPNCSVTSTFPPDANVANPTYCNRPNNSIIVPYNQADCPYPLKYNRDGEADFAESNYDLNEICLYPCPDPMWTEGEWIGGIVSMMVLSGPSVLMSAAVIVTLLLMPSKRKYPGWLSLWITICSFMIDFAILFFSIVAGGNTELVCTGGSPPLPVDEDNADENNAWGVPCIFQGTIILFFSVAGAFWWLAFAIKLTENVFLGADSKLFAKFHWPYHLLAWGIALACMIVALAGKSIGATRQVPYCFFTPDDEYYSWFLFLFPIGVCFVIVTVLVPICTLRVLWLRFIKREKSERTGHFVRIFFLVACYWGLVLCPWVYRSYTRSVEDEVKDSITEQVTCSAITGGECELEKRVNYGVWIVSLFYLGSHGIVVSFCITNKGMFKFWYYLIKGCLQDPKNAWSHICKSVSGSGSNKEAEENAKL